MILYNLAVEHGMGPKIRAIEFCPYVTEIMYMNEKLDNDEIAAELEDYMDTNFSTELEDNSAIQVANELLRFYKYCKEGNELIALEELSKLPALQPWIMTSEPMRERHVRASRTENANESDSESDGSNDHKMETMNDDWVEVKTRRKK
ncbi:uncharacterized protein [Venturia canescens]|uniref:uncharacterized protein isoform X2 n=1 Tax=Venturia canescens TaxID=32260 RepID=UPI001C9BE9A3|nr:uncharacterized protein LOC122412981 isoform X2 [Venturia canescens]